jgi:DNA polymerase
VSCIPDDDIHAFSSQFDERIWNRVAVPKYGFPKLKKPMQCLSARCFHAGFPGSLAEAAKIISPYQKGKSVKYLFNTLNKKGTLPPDKFEILINYCKRDVLASWHLHLKLPLLCDYEQKVFALDRKINARGLPIDVERVVKARKLVDVATADINDRAKRLTGGIVENITEVAKIKEFCKQEGASVLSIDKRTIEHEIKRADISASVKEVLALRQDGGKSSLAKLDAMLAAVDEHGRIHQHLQYHGTHTGRWAGRIIQPQNFPRIKHMIDPNVYDLSLPAAYKIICSVGKPLTVISSSLRNFIRPKLDKVLFVADYATIEARIVFWLAKEFEILEKVKTGTDIYCWAASDFYKREITKENEKERFLFKSAILGCGYGMGAGRFSEMFGVSLAEAEVAINWYRNRFGNVKKLWYALQEGAKRAIQNPGTRVRVGQVVFSCDREYLILRLPSGRCLRYWNPKVTVVAEDWRDIITYEGNKAFNGAKVWGAIRIWGGTFLENISQAIARDITVEGIFRLEDNDFPVILQVHDEIVSEVPRGRDLTKFIELLTTPVSWAPDLPLAVEAKELEHYVKL